MMLLTEEEARKLECPVKTYCVNEIDVVQNGQVPFYAQQPCQGSACIAWRWSPAYRYSKVGSKTIRTGIAAPSSGYCGLAGTPE